MKFRITLLLAITIISFLYSISILAADGDAGKVVATVNGKNINEETLRLYSLQRNLPPGSASPKQTNALIQELVNRELIYQDAVAVGVDKAPAIQAEIEHQRINIIASAMISRSSDRFSVSEEDMKKEYEARKGELGGNEMKASHILLETEATANEMIAKLDKGENFAELARKHSTGPSASNGGDLGWFSADQMVQPFSEAASKLEKGKYTRKPVKTQFGWHVILLEDSRSIDPPAYETIKEQIRVGLQNSLIEEYILSLRKKAKIEIK